MNHIRREKATIQDLGDINAIMYSSKGYWGYTQSFMDEFMDRFCVTEKCIKELKIYCVYIDDGMKGFYGFKKNEDNQDELDLFFLDPSCIGKGLGRQLWNLCLDTAKGLKIKEFIICVDPNAEEFYLKMGCSKIGTKLSPMLLDRYTPILRYTL